MNFLIQLNTHYQRFFHSLFHPHLNVKGSLLTLNESILLSWPFVILGVIVNTVFSIVITVSMLGESTLKAFPFFDYGSLITWPILIGLFFSLWGILFFPIKAYLYALFFKMVLGFYQRVCRTYSADPSLAFDLVASSMSSHTFDIVPGLGAVAQSIAQFMSVYKGLKERMHLSSLACACIVLTPGLLVMFFIIGICYSCFLLIALLS